MISETGSGGLAEESDRLAFRWIDVPPNLNSLDSFKTTPHNAVKANSESDEREWAEKNARPSNVLAEIEARKKWDPTQRTGGSILGQIHLDLANYHEMERFTKVDAEGYDQEAALYHLRHAADCGHLEAIITMGRIALQLSHDILPDITMEDNLANIDMGLDFMNLVIIFFI